MKKKNLSEFSEAGSLKITTRLGKFSYIFPNLVNFEKKSFSTEGFRNGLIKRCPKCTEDVVLNILKEKFSNLNNDCIYQAPVLVYSNDSEKINYQNLYNNSPNFKGKENKETQQVMYVDFCFKKKGVFLEVGSNSHHSKEGDEFRASVLKKLFPNATVINITYYNSPKEFREKLIEALEMIDQLPDNEEILSGLDKTDWIKNHNENIRTARLIKYCEKVIQLHPDDKKICEEMTQQIETLKALIS